MADPQRLCAVRKRRFRTMKLRQVAGFVYSAQMEALERVVSIYELVPRIVRVSLTFIGLEEPGQVKSRTFHVDFSVIFSLFFVFGFELE